MNAPLGNPASDANSASASAVSEVSSAGFSTTRPVYIVIRNSDVNTSWNKALFAPGTGFMSKAFLAQPLIEDAAGFTYDYADAGLCHTA